MKWVRYLLYALLLVVFVLLAGSLHPMWSEDSKVWIYNSELVQLITITKDLKQQLEVSQTNCYLLTQQLNGFNSQMQNSQSNYTLLLQQVELSTNQLAMLEQAQIDLTNSWQRYKTGAEQTISNLERERILWMALGIGGLVGGIAIAIIF